MRIVTLATLFVFAAGCVGSHAPAPGEGGAGAGSRSERPSDVEPDEAVTDFPRAPSGLPDIERDLLTDIPRRVLTRTRTWALPSAEGSGIACAGESIWLLSEGSVLQEIHLPTGEIQREYKVDLGVGAGTQAYGIERVGEAIWISVAGNRNAIVVVDAQSGEILKSWSSPTELGPSDMSLSAEGVWLADGIGGLFLLDRANASVLWETKLVFPERDHGIAIRGDLVVIGNLFGGMWMHRRSDLSVIAELVDASGNRLEEARVGAMCFQGERLRVLNGRGLEEFAIEE